MVFYEFYGNIDCGYFRCKKKGINKMSDLSNIEKVDFPASLLRRGIAYIIDCLFSTLPMMLIFAMVLGKFPMEPIVLSPAPIWGMFTVYDMPLEVDDELNTIENEDGSEFEMPRNVSFGATSIRICSVLSLVFYVLYTTLCTYLYGKTVGKKLMGIEVVHTGPMKPVFWCLLRETFGKTILNTTLIVPVVSIIMVLVTPKHRAIHDYIGSTTVVETL